MGQKGLVRRSVPGVIVLLAGLGAVASAGSHAPRGAERGRPAQDRVLTKLTLPPVIPGRRLGTSSNWAGSVRTGTNFTRVEATWQVPVASSSSSSSCSSTNSAHWIGFDGYNNGTVEQIGTSSDWSGGPKYYAWLEMYPQPAWLINRTVRAGDTISAKVEYQPATGKFLLTMTNSSLGWTITSQQSGGSRKRSSVEWIAERPYSSSSGLTPLTDFGTVCFSGASFGGGGTTSLSTLDMVNNTTGDLLASTSGSCVAWKNCW
jgi:hypothetical protein